RSTRPAASCPIPPDLPATGSGPPPAPPGSPAWSPPARARRRAAPAPGPPPARPARPAARSRAPRGKRTTPAARVVHLVQLGFGGARGGRRLRFRRRLAQGQDAPGAEDG